jgi:hypothetical protein
MDQLSSEGLHAHLSSVVLEMMTAARILSSAQGGTQIKKGVWLAIVCEMMGRLVRRQSFESFGTSRVSDEYLVTEPGEAPRERAADVARANDSNIHLCPFF